MADTPPLGIDLYADQGGRLVASMIALIMLPTLFVIARLISRRVSHAGYWYDDLWVTIACVLCYVQCICVLVSERHNGFGRHIYILNDPAGNTREFVKILYVYEIGYYSSTAAVKIAILAFYRRIFPVQQLKLLLYIAIGVVSAYFVGSILAVIFQCSPIHRFWDLTQPGHCSNGDLVQIVPGAFNCVIDFFIILLPLPLLWRLRTTVSQKGVLTGIFVCAGFVCIISIVRLVVLSPLDAYDVTWNYVNPAIWSAAEPCMGVISACIPSLRPLVSILFRGTTRAIGGTKIGGKSSAQDASSGSSRTWRSRSDADQFSRRDEPTETRGQWGHDVTVHGGKTGVVAGSDISLAEMNVPAGGIRVKDEVVVTSSDWIPYKHEVY